MSRAIEWAARDAVPVAVEAPMCVQSTTFRQKDSAGERLVVHLFNGINTTNDHGSPEADVPSREEVVPVGGIKVLHSHVRFCWPKKKTARGTCDARRRRGGRAWLRRSVSSFRGGPGFFHKCKIFFLCGCHGETELRAHPYLTKMTLRPWNCFTVRTNICARGRRARFEWKPRKLEALERTGHNPAVRCAYVMD
jgi:hypothetical protein